MKFNYAKAIKFLVSKGIKKESITNSTIDDTQLSQLNNFIEQEYGKNKLLGLHVGSFLGVSFSGILSKMKSLNDDSVLVGIDPNIAQHEITKQLPYFTMLVNYLGLHENTVMLTGYPVEACLKNEYSAENVLRNLAFTSKNKFNFIFIEHGYGQQYLNRMLLAVDCLLKPNGVLIINDKLLTAKDIFSQLNFLLYKQDNNTDKIKVFRKVLTY